MNVSPGDGGTVRVDQTAPSAYPAAFTFKSGTSVRLEAVPASGYDFKNWGGDLSGTTNPATIVIECNKELTAKFSRIKPAWWRSGGIIAGVMIAVGVIIWFAVRRRTT